MWVFFLNVRVLIDTTMADGLYSSFAEVLSACQSFKDDLAAILDPETGFAPRMRQLCEQLWAESGRTS